MGLFLMIVHLLFIIRSKYQLIFCVNDDWILNFLFKYKKFY